MHEKRVRAYGTHPAGCKQAVLDFEKVSGRLKACCIFQTACARKIKSNQFQIRPGILGAAAAQLDIEAQIVGGIGVFNRILIADLAAFV